MQHWHIYDVDTLVHFQFGTMPFTLGQQYLSGPLHDGESAAHPYVWESKVNTEDAFRLLPPGLAQSTSNAQEQLPGLAQYSGAHEGESHLHTANSAADGQRYSCDRANCIPVKFFKRHQDLERHIREVHDSDSPRKCPFCPPDRRPWKRPYLLKDHLINNHRDAFAAHVFERIVGLRGKNVFVFVDAIESLQS